MSLLTPPCKEQKTISSSELTDKDIEELAEKEFSKITIKLLKNTEKEFTEYVTQEIAILK